jgi:hypothetical protein
LAPDEEATVTTSDLRGPHDRIGILWRGDRRDLSAARNSFFDPLAKTFAEFGITAEPVVYADDSIPQVREELLCLGGVLVWVDPIAGGHDRSHLDALLREVSARGVWVSTHPDVILKMGTKEVLHRTRTLGWGTDTRLYANLEEFRDEFPRALASAGPRVLKQNRGNGGIGVFRVELVGAEGRPGPEALVRVQHAQRGSSREEMRLGDFMRRCEAYLAGSGRIVDQPLLERHGEGMVRCYLVGNRVAGFGHQLVTALMDPAPGELAPPLPPPRVYFGPSKSDFQALKVRLESEWVPQMQTLLGLDTTSLPVLWDADFLLGPKTRSGEDNYVLCEINVSAVFPFPDEARAPLGRTTAARMREARETRGKSRGKSGAPSKIPTSRWV